MLALHKKSQQCIRVCKLLVKYTDSMHTKTKASNLRYQILAGQSFLIFEILLLFDSENQQSKTKQKIWNFEDNLCCLYLSASTGLCVAGPPALPIKCRRHIVLVSWIIALKRKSRRDGVLFPLFIRFKQTGIVSYFYFFSSCALTPSLRD